MPRLSDDQLRQLLKSRRKELWRKLRPDELRRMFSLHRQEVTGGKPGVAGEARKRLAALKESKEPKATAIPGAFGRVALAENKPVVAMHELASLGSAVAGLPGKVRESVARSLSPAPEGEKPEGMMDSARSLTPQERVFLAIRGMSQSVREGGPKRQLESFAKLFSPEVIGAANQVRTKKIIDLVLDTKSVTDAVLDDPSLIMSFTKTLARGIADSFNKTVTDPAEQMREAPIEFLFNAADIVTAGFGPGKLVQLNKLRKLTAAVETSMNTAKDLTTAARLVDEAADTVEGAKALHAAVDTAEGRLSQVIEDARAIGRHDIADQAEKVRKTFTGLKERQIEKIAPEAEKQVEALRNLKRFEKQAQNAAEIVEQSKVAGGQRGAAQTKLVKAVAGSALGGVVGSVAAAKLNRGEHPWAVPLGAITGALVPNLPAIWRLGKKMDLFRRAARPGEGGLLSGSTDLEREIIEPLIEMLPEEVSYSGLGKRTERAAPLIGAAAGAWTGAFQPDQEPNPTLGLVGGVAGFALGSAVARGNRMISREGGFRVRDTMKRLFLESRGLPPLIADAQRRMFDSRNGLLTRIMDNVRVLAKADRAEGEVIQQYMAGERHLSTVPERFRGAAVEGRLLFDELATEIVRVGLAGDEAGAVAQKILNGRGTYLPRLYLTYEGGDDLSKVEKWLSSQGENMARLSDREYLKRRKDIPKDVREAWGEILDNPAYLLAKRGTVTASDVHIRDYQNLIASMPEVTLSEDAAKLAADTGEFFNRTGARGAQIEHLRSGGEVYRKLPGGKEGRKFGPLAGKYVSENVALDLESMYDSTGRMARLFGKGTQIFKRSKVTWNPATLMRNWWGQVPLNDFGGVHPGRMDLYLSGIQEYLAKGEVYREARHGGLFGGEFFGVEIADLAKTAERTGAKSWGGLGMEWVSDLATKPFRQAERFHEATEQINKLILYRHARTKLGMDVESAVRHAKRFGFDYREVPRWVQVVRKSPFGAPFISFSYKALPRVFEAAIAAGNPRQLLSFWKYPLSFAAINEYSARQIDVLGKDERGFLDGVWRVAKNGLGLGLIGGEDTYKNLMADYVGAQQLLFPGRDKFGRLQFWDLTYLLAWGDIGELGKGNVGRAFARYGFPVFPRQLEPSNPWLQLTAGFMAGGKNLFTGRDIVPEGSTRFEGLTEGLRMIMQQFGPAWIPGVGFSGIKLQRSFSGEYAVDPHVPSPGMAVLSEVFGLKNRPIDPRTAAQAKLRDIEGRLSAVNRRPGRTAEQRRRRDAARKRVVKEKRDLLDIMKGLPKTPQKLLKAEQERRKRERGSR